MKTIDFCIPFINSGMRYTEFLVSNLLSSATYPERITVSINIHSEHNIELISKSFLKENVKRVVLTPGYVANVDAHFAIENIIGSANHCRAIQGLVEHTTADVIIFCDHDMAFLIKGWDEKICSILEDHDLCGVEYEADGFPFSLVGSKNMELYCHNYQHIPNLTFFAITKYCLNTYFSSGISQFHHFLASGGLPIQIVNTPQMSSVLGLPVGTLWWMDSGYEIPFVIKDNALKFKIFTSVKQENQNVFAPNIFPEQTVEYTTPNVFVDNIDGEPFIAHYRQGTVKSLMFGNDDVFDNFKNAVNEYLTRKSE